MRISSNRRVHYVLLLSLLGANLVLYSAAPWLRKIPLKGASAEPPTMANVLTNEAYLGGFLEAIHAKRRILFLGSSESVRHYNMGAQLNGLSVDGPEMVVLARGGMSPIHCTLAIARAKGEGLQIPPLIRVVNPVYFTRSHDVIDDGWMSTTIQSPIFMEMNHRNLRDYLTEEVQESYDSHFGFRRILYPATIQEYIGNLVYLAFHQPSAKEVRRMHVKESQYVFEGSIPKYDEQKNVWEGIKAVDRFEKNRWRVSEVAESVNLKGLASSMEILREERAPVLLVILPVNRQFYEYHQVDMEEFDGRYRDIRRVLRTMARGENIYFIDLFDTPRLHFGFRDRMHNDAYGFAQLAKYVFRSEAYKRYMKAVTRYYDDTSLHMRMTARKAGPSTTSQ